MNLTTTDLPRIPLSKLHLSPLNARKTRNGDVDDLAASIAAHGLLQNLTVTVNDKPGEFEVVAGGRRLAAMQQLLHEGRLPEALQAGVPCLVIEDNDVAHEASTAENTLREAMHPADEFDAFSRMVEAGKPVEDIAAHFGVAETVVKQRLKLARVAPDLFQLYRDGKMELSKLQALTVSDDHEAQRKAWIEYSDWGAHKIREYLVGDKSVRASAPVAKFVGLDAYEAAGGVVKRDLFGSEAWCEDPALLDALALDKLEARAQQLREAGWSWVESRLSLEHAERTEYPALKPEGVQEILSPELEARLLQVQKRIDEIDEIDADEVTEEQGLALEIERAALDEEADAIAAEVEERWPAELMSKSGCLVTFTLDGQLVVYYGRLRPGEKVGKGNVVSSAAKSAAAAKDEKPKKPELSADLTTTLLQHRAAAIRASLAAMPQLAADLLLAQMVGQLFGQLHFGMFDLRVGNIHDRTAGKAQDLVESPARNRLDEARKALGIPRKQGDVLPWIQKLNDAAWSQLFGVCAAHMLENLGADDLRAFDTLLSIDMAEWWAVDAENFLGRVNKALILDAVTEARGKDEAAKLATLKRDALVVEAAKLLAGTGWLPKPLRGPGYALKNAAPAKPAAATKPAKKPAAKAKPAAKPKAKKAAKKPSAKKAKAGKS